MCGEPGSKARGPGLPVSPASVGSPARSPRPQAPGPRAGEQKSLCSDRWGLVAVRGSGGFRDGPRSAELAPWARARRGRLSPHGPALPGRPRPLACILSTCSHVSSHVPGVHGVGRWRAHSGGSCARTERSSEWLLRGAPGPPPPTPATVLPGPRWDMPLGACLCPAALLSVPLPGLSGPAVLWMVPPVGWGPGAGGRGVTSPQGWGLGSGSQVGLPLPSPANE